MSAMTFSVLRLTVLAAALFGAIKVSAAPVETPELETRAPAQVITKCTQAKTVALTYAHGFHFQPLLD
jgi:hypothetical protein